MGSREHPLPLGWEGRRGHPAWWEQRWGPRAVLAHPPCSPSAEPGSGSCKPRPPCTDKDFFYTHTACDAGGEVMRGHPGVVPLSPGVPPAHPLPRQTQLMYKWAEPKICSEELPQAARLPPSGIKTRCPPCNPGFAKGNGSTCQPCPYGSYSNGSGKAALSLSPKCGWGTPSCRGKVGVTPVQGCPLLSPWLQ